MVVSLVSCWGFRPRAARGAECAGAAGRRARDRGGCFWRARVPHEACGHSTIRGGPLQSARRAAGGKAGGWAAGPEPGTGRDGVPAKEGGQCRNTESDAVTAPKSGLQVTGLQGPAVKAGRGMRPGKAARTCRQAAGCGPASRPGKAARTCRQAAGGGGPARRPGHAGRPQAGPGHAAWAEGRGLVNGYGPAGDTLRRNRQWVTRIWACRV
jgi:hypothetical protein